MAEVFVPVATRVPSPWRIIRRDSVAGLLAIFFVLGCVLCTVYVAEARRPAAPPVTTRLSTSVRLIQLAPASPASTLPWLVTGIGFVVLLPLRLWSMRRLFRRGDEVVGHVETQHRGYRSTTIAYRYDYQGKRYTGSYPMSLRTSVAHGASVAVVVDPDRPARSILKHAFILEAVDPVPPARLHRG